KEEENEEENEDTLELTVRDRIDIVLESYLETGNSIIEVKGCDEKITHITTKSAENYVKEEEGAEGVGEPKSSSDDPEKRENAHKLTVPGAEGPTENYVKEEEAGESEKLKSFPDDSEEEEDAHDLTVLDAEKLTGNCAKEGGETERFKKPESSSDALERHHAASEELSSIPLQGQTADSTGKKKTNGSKKKLTPFGCLLF
ncbi:MAG: hypothetical protein LBB24_01705, partial [Rickettsiales bacterium]|nr:hypothetical protein [Rickettsiales bacterium]